MCTIWNSISSRKHYPSNKCLHANLSFSQCDIMVELYWFRYKNRVIISRLISGSNFSSTLTQNSFYPHINVNMASQVLYRILSSIKFDHSIVLMKWQILNVNQWRRKLFFQGMQKILSWQEQKKFLKVFLSLKIVSDKWRML